MDYFCCSCVLGCVLARALHLPKVHIGIVGCGVVPPWYICPREAILDEAVGENDVRNELLQHIDDVA